MPAAPDDGPNVFSALHLNSCKKLYSVAINMFMHVPDKSDMDITATQLDDYEEDFNATIEELDAHVTGLATPQLQAAQIGQETPTGGTGTPQQSAPPPPTFYTANEWHTPLVVLSQLPPTVVDITLGIELVGSDDDIQSHLKSVPVWVDYEKHLLQLPALQIVRIRMLKTITDVVVPVEWDKVNRAYIASQMPVLAEKKLLNFERP